MHINAESSLDCEHACGSWNRTSQGFMRSPHMQILGFRGELQQLQQLQSAETLVYED